MFFALTPEQLALQARARDLAQTVFAPRAAEIDRSEQYPWENARLLNENGFMGMTIPKAYGGQGLSYLDAVLVIEQIAQACGVTARIVVESNMGAISTVMKYGTEEQKRLGADSIFTHADKPAICITEPGAGSAATEMTTHADKRGNGGVLNGKKHWITGAGVSRLHLVFARAFDTDGTELGIGGFLATRDETPGLRIGKREPTMGLRGIPEAEVTMSVIAEPAPGSLIPMAKLCSPLTQPGSQRCFCSSLAMMAMAREGPLIAICATSAVLKHTRATSSSRIVPWMMGAPEPP